MTEENEPAASHYQSEIGDSFHSLPKHVRLLVGNIPQLTLPADLDLTSPQDLVVATDGSVLFDVGYHSWVVSTKDEEIIISGGGPDDGAPNQMTSYRSELGGGMCRNGSDKNDSKIGENQHQISNICV
jgi:hypothetical protein